MTERILIKYGFKKVVILLISAAFIVRFAFAVFTPSWNAPDEYQHYWVADYIAVNNEYPKVQDRIVDYEAYQPPLYYYLLSEVIRIVSIETIERDVDILPDFNLIILRLFSVLMGVLSVYFSYKIISSYNFLNEKEKILSIAFIAFLPVFAGTNSVINNDSIVVLLTAVSIYYIAVPGIAPINFFISGIFFGLALNSKLNSAPMIFLILYVGFQRVKLSGEEFKKYFVSFAIPALILFLVLALRNMQLYDSALAINPGKDQEFGVSLQKLFFAIRNLTWSFWAAFGKYYELTPGVVVYLTVFLPIMAVAVYGWAINKPLLNNASKLFLISFLPMFAASLWFTFSYPLGSETSWGKNLFPALPFIAVFFIKSWELALKKIKYLKTEFVLFILLFFCAWGIISLNAFG